MKNKMKLGMCSALLISGLAYGTMGTGDLVVHAASNTNVAQQVASQFTDVKTDHYSYEAIQWAQSKGIVSGYGDGRFGPNNPVTEAHFAKMISNYFNIKDTYGDLIKTSKNPHWSDENYDALAQYAVPLNGYFDNTIRNQPIKRGLVAQVLTYVAGYRTDLKGSIEFLLDNNVTSGQNPEYKDKDLNKFFGVSNNLTRSQAVAFLHRLEKEKLNQLSETIEQPNGKSLNEIATTGKKRVDDKVVITENKVEKTITTKTSNGMEVTINKPIEVPKDKDGNYVVVPTDTKYIEPAVERSVSRDTKEHNNLYKSAKEFVKEEYDYTSFTEGSGQSLMVYNKDSRESVFTASLRSKEVAKKLVDSGDLPFLTTLTIIFSDDNLKGNEEYYADLMISMGYELTKEEIIENLNKVNKLAIYEDFEYKNHKFSIGFGNTITVDKLY